MKRALDLYCGAGGASMGLINAGYEVHGVDKHPQPRYSGKSFRLLNVLEMELTELQSYDLIWASPPCQAHSTISWQHGYFHENFIPTTREMLIASGVPFVIENVPNAPLRLDTLLCGKMFGLRLIRHRIFEISFSVPQLPHPIHDDDYITVTGHPGGSSKRDGGKHFGNTAQWKEAMGIDWMVGRELAQAIPPVYSEYIARYAP